MTDSKLKFNFVIVGASIAGLAAAIGLKNSGHKVLILEKDSELGGGPSGLNGCARVPPNGTKILEDWRLGAQTKRKAAGMPGFSFYKYQASAEPVPDFIGVNRWNEELLFEARGGYMQFRHQDLLRILFDAAHLPPLEKEKYPDAQVSVLFGAEVVAIDCDACLVTLRSGQTHTGDAIIGADGASGLVRRILMEEEGVTQDSDVPTGLAMYGSIVPKESVLRNGLGPQFYDELGSSIWIGSNRAAMTNPVGHANDLTIWVYTPDSQQDGSWKEKADIKLTDVIGPCDPRIEKLAMLAGPATCVQIKKHYDLNSWVSRSGRVLAVGEAAHPFPPGGFHPYSIALEDAVFIGRMFERSHDRGRIPQFFHAFQEAREDRCTRIRDMDQAYIDAMTLPDGPTQVERDKGMRSNHAAGRNALEGDYQQMLEDFKLVFGYEANDAADEWWLDWGRYHQNGGSGDGSSALASYLQQSLANATSHVVEEEEVEDI
ncbi:hypothetical protein C8R47DRAFT_1154381 [Mycena vitilis]|nr:hypothetical protein C8R47DRAFT_1154381 [Mycena vitilis]